MQHVGYRSRITENNSLQVPPGFILSSSLSLGGARQNFFCAVKIKALGGPCGNNVRACSQHPSDSLTPL